MNHEQELLAKVEDFIVAKSWNFNLEGTTEGCTASITQKPDWKLGRQIDEIML